MNREKFRCHPTIIIENLGAGFIVIALILINNIDDFITIVTEIDQIPSLQVILGFLGALLVMAILAFWQYMVWRKTWISITDSTLEIERNTINRKHKTYGLKNISNINLEQNIFEQILGTYKIKIDTDSLSTSNKTDIKIVLSKKKAIAFKAEVMRLVAENKQIEQVDEIEMQFAKNDDYDVAYSVPDVIKHSLYALPISSILSLILIVVAVFMLLGIIDTGEDFLDIFIQSMGGMAALLIGLFTSASRGVMSFFKFFNFRAKRLKNKVVISQGLLKKRTYEIPIDRINAIKIIEPAISRIFNKQSIELVNVGVGDEKDEGAFLLLSKSKKEIDEFMATLLPEFVTDTDENVEGQPKEALLITLIHQLVYIIPTTVGFIIAMVYAPMNDLVTGLVIAGFVLFILFSLGSTLLRFKTAGLNIANDYVAIAGGTYKKVTKLIKYDKIQYVKASESPLARLKKLQRYRLYILANAANNLNETGLFSRDKINDIYERM